MRKIIIAAHDGEIAVRPVAEASIGWMNDGPVVTLLEIRDLETHFRIGAGLVRAVDRVSHTVEEGEIVAIVCECGRGTSVGALSILGLIPDRHGRVVGGEILFMGRDLARLGNAQRREIRDRDIGMVLQEPMSSLDPVRTIGLQPTETLELHRGLTQAEAEARGSEPRE